MADPPFDFDTSNPTVTGFAVSGFPANEQAFRDVVASASAVVVDASTGLGPIALSYTTTQKNALVLPPAGLLVYDTTLSKLQINLGTPSAPTWTTVT